ncbi:hypothetical protein AgCh_016831 [Apium graveolens]
MMGSGKTTVGQIVSEVLGYSFFDRCSKEQSSRISSSSRDSEASGNHAVDSQQLNSIKVEKPTCNLALDEDPSQQASLKPLLQKREKLSVQRSSIEEELALCESHIQTFLNGEKLCPTSSLLPFIQMETNVARTYGVVEIKDPNGEENDDREAESDEDDFNEIDYA